MKKLSVLLFVLLIPSAAAAEDDNCYLVVAGLSATADGSVMLAHNEDNGTDKVFRFRRVERRVHVSGEFVELHGGGRLEQTDTTWAYTVWEMPGMHFSHGMVNEHAVAVVSNSCPSREDRPMLTDGGIGPLLRWLVVERARSAREGAELAGALIERFGYSASGRTLTIADPREAWQVAMVNGKHWVARRVPDNQVAVLANSYGIHRIDLADTVNFMGSADLIDYARERGWYDPAMDKEFDFERAYAGRGRLTDPNQRLRQWTGFRHFAAPDYAPPPDGEPLPFSIEPLKPLTPEQMFAALRDHYEASQFEAGDCLPHVTPCGASPRAVCHGSTNHGDLFQLRGNVPSPLRTIWWYSFWRPCSAPFVPLYPAAGSVPAALGFEVHDHVFRDPSSGEMPGRDKAIGVFRELTLRVDERRWRDINTVRARWRQFERDQWPEVRKLESEVVSLQSRDNEITNRLAEFGEYRLEQAMKAAAEMLE
ncbi:MAG: dipeptidase [Candidatus Glassbacteria bacterium]|nr:dipeptidase [Candidatus Glassbacteria bacterium]